MAFASQVAGDPIARATFQLERSTNEKDFSWPTIYAGYDFLETLEITINQGRDLSKEYATDRNQVVLINPKAAEG